MKIAVVTTFHEKGLKQYGQRMINTFCENWPKEVTLHLYPEECNPQVPDHSRITLKRLEEIPELMAFKEKWKNDPKAVGKLATGPADRKGKQPGIGFRWDAIRFSHKVYAVCHAAANTDADILMWMDADMVCHTPVPKHFLDKMVDTGLGFLGRPKKFTECGLYSMDLRDPATKEFIIEFQKAYDSGRLFSFQEWNDCWVFDEVRKEIKQKYPNWRWYDWAAGLIKGEGHPLINSDWGAYLDHLKGRRKEAGKSDQKDLIVRRREQYWITR